MLLVSLTVMKAAEVNEATAIRIAQKRISGEIEKVTTINQDGKKVFYIVQFTKGGWALVAADDTSTPLLAYSPDGVYPKENEQPENMRYVINQLSNRVIEKARSMKERDSEWNETSSAKGTATTASTKIEPLIKVNWNQTGSYYKYTPTTSDGKHAVVGCVAVGMAQAMSVAKHPSRPTGYKAYNHSTFGSIYIDYDKEPDYDWNSIISGANNKDGAARLLWHCGVSVTMDYGVDGSGAQTSSVASALKTYFGYPQSVTYLKRSDYSEEDWNDIMINELDNGRAVIYSGNDPLKAYGHCFNLDGYDTGMYHVNWGWGGNGNGYFNLRYLHDSTMDMDYTQNQGAVIGVRPPSELPSNILLSNESVATGQPAGTVVGNITVESEATDPSYTFEILGEYNPVFHKRMPAPFQVINGQLVTTEILTSEDYGSSINIEITVTNTQNNGTYTRTFTIELKASTGISKIKESEMIISEQYYSLTGERLSSMQPGVNIIRKQLKDGSVRTVKVIK